MCSHCKKRLPPYRLWSHPKTSRNCGISWSWLGSTGSSSCSLQMKLLPSTPCYKKEQGSSWPNSATMHLTYWSQTWLKCPGCTIQTPIKPFKLFTDTSKHSYSGILHEVEVSDQPKAKPNLVPIVYFSSSFSKTWQLWNTTKKECYTVNSKIFILPSGHKMHSVLQP